MRSGSVKKNRAEEISARKKARQEKWWIFPVVLLLCVLICGAALLACRFLYTPLTYTDHDVEAYVRSVYGDSWTLQKKSRSADGNGSGYLYAGENGEIFSVFSLTVPVYQDGLASGHYRRALYDNYFSTVIEKKQDALDDLIREFREKDGPELEIEESGESAGAYGAQYGFCMYLTRVSQLEQAAELLEKLDTLLSFSCRKGETPYSQMRRETPCVEIFLKPDGWLSEGADAVTGAAKTAAADSIRNGAFVDWRSMGERDAFRISRIPLTDASSPGRLRQVDVRIRLENDYVDAAKTSGKEYYSISKDLWNKYPAPVLTLVNAGGYNLLTGEMVPADPAAAETVVQETESPDAPAEAADQETELPGGEPPFTYQFIYHRKTGTYWLIGLDPCEDFDENPFGNYPRRGAFAFLVKCLGGTTSADRWKGSWRIGSKEWEASLETHRTPQSAWTYEDMTLTCDGNRTLLDPVPEAFAGTGAVPSGRPYSIRDLIRMLDVRITINQKDMTAVMFRDYTYD